MTSKEPPFILSPAVLKGLVVLLALLARVVFVFGLNQPRISTDSVTYLDMADAILSGNPYGFFPNGLPLLLAFLKGLFGSGHLIFAMLICNIALSTCMVWFAMELARGLGHAPWISLGTGVVLAVYPHQLNYARLVLSEVPATVCLVAAFLMLFRSKWFLAGFLFWVSILFRTNFIAVLPLVCMAVFWSAEGRKAVLFLLGGFLAGVALNGCLLSAGVVREPTNGGMNLLLATPRGRAATIHMEKRDGEREMTVRISGFTDDELAHPVRTYWREACRSPFLFMKERMRQTWILWGWPEGGAGRSLMARFMISLKIPLLLMAIGCVRLFWKQKKVILLGTPIVALTLLHALLFAQPRFVFPCEPFLVVLSVYYVSERWLKGEDTRCKTHDKMTCLRILS